MFQEKLATMIKGKKSDFHKDFNGIIKFRDKICLLAK